MLRSIGGHAVWVETVGFGGALVTLHGGPGLDHAWFRPALDPLSSKAKVVYYDQAGCGRSARDVPLANGFGTWVDELEALRAALGVERMVLLGHSAGAMLAQSYAVRFPARVAGLVLVAGAPKLDFEAQALEAGRRLHGEAAIAGWIAAASQPARDDDELRARFLTLLPLCVHRADAATLGGVEARARYSAAALRYGVEVAMPAFDVTARLASLRAPTLVIGGKHDWLCPIELGPRRLAATIPGARLAIFDQSAHFPFLEEPARFVKVVGDFLDALE